MFVFFMEEQEQVLLQKTHCKKKSNMKSPAMSPPKKDPIPYEDINILITKQDPSLPPIMEKYPPVYKPLFNDKHDSNST